MADPANKEPWYRTNPQLWPIKCIYFTIYAAIGSLHPFIPLVMKQLGISVMQLGFLYGTMPILTLFTTRYVEWFADKTQRHKLVGTAFTLLTGLCYLSLLVIPHNDTSIMPVKTQLQCRQHGSFINDCHTGERKSCPIGVAELVENTSMGSNDCETSCTVPVTSTDLHVCFTNGMGAINDETCKKTWNKYGEDRNIQGLGFIIGNLRNVTPTEDLGQELETDDQKCKSFDLGNVTYTGETFQYMLCSAETELDCEITCKDEFSKACYRSSKIFWIVAVIFLFCNIFFTPTMSIINRISLVVVAEKNGSWDYQRVYGTVSMAVFAVISTFIMDLTRNPDSNINYSASFYIFVVFCVITSIAIFVTKTSERLYCRTTLKGTHGVLRYPEMVVIVGLVFFFGIMNSVTEVFLFWYLHDLGSTHVNLGLCLVASCSMEAIMMVSAEKIIKKIGHVPCLYIALLAYAVRFFGYSFLTNPWYVLPLELLHGVSFVLMFAAATSYAGIITTQEITPKAGILIHLMFFVLGKCAGCSVTADLFSPSGLGAVWTFRFYGFLALGLLIIYASVQTIFFRKKEKPTVTDEQSESKDKDVDMQGEAAVTPGDRLLAVDVNPDVTDVRGAPDSEEKTSTDDVDNLTPVLY